MNVVVDREVEMEAVVDVKVTVNHSKAMVGECLEICCRYKEITEVAKDSVSVRSISNGNTWYSTLEHEYMNQEIPVPRAVLV